MMQLPDGSDEALCLIWQIRCAHSLHRIQLSCGRGSNCVCKWDPRLFSVPHTCQLASAVPSVHHRHPQWYIQQTRKIYKILYSVTHLNHMYPLNLYRTHCLAILWCCLASPWTGMSQKYKALSGPMPLKFSDFSVNVHNVTFFLVSSSSSQGIWWWSLVQCGWLLVAIAASKSSRQSVGAESASGI